jgi:hypothetical protein
MDESLGPHSLSFKYKIGCTAVRMAAMILEQKNRLDSTQNSIKERGKYDPDPAAFVMDA